MAGRESRAFQQLYDRLADRIIHMDTAIDRLAEEDIYIVGLTIQTPWKRDGDYFCIVRAMVGGEKKVMFQSADTYYELLAGIANRIINKQFDWKDDNYA